MPQLIKIFTRSFLLLAISFLFLLVTPFSAYADTVTLSGKVTNSSGTAINGTTVTVTDPSTNTTISTTTTDSAGSYTIIISAGTYNVQVTPPLESNSSPAIALSQKILADTVLNFILAPAGSLTVSGHVYGPLGNPIPNQSVTLGSASTTTNASGYYSVTVSPGNQSILDINNFSGSGNDASLNTPHYYRLYVNNYPATQSTILDITIPAKKVLVHVQDTAGNPIANTQIDAGNATIANSEGLAIGGNITNANGQSGYGSPNIKTNANGDVLLWLIPTNKNFSYSLTAIPPSTSNFQSKTVRNITVTNDTNVTITLERPVTLSGHVYGPLGNPLPNQSVTLGSQVTSTDASGKYSLTVNPGTFSILDINNFSGSGNSP